MWARRLKIVTSARDYVDSRHLHSCTAPCRERVPKFLGERSVKITVDLDERAASLSGTLLRKLQLFLGGDGPSSGGGS